MWIGEEGKGLFECIDLTIVKTIQEYTRIVRQSVFCLVKKKTTGAFPSTASCCQWGSVIFEFVFSSVDDVMFEFVSSSTDVNITKHASC